jgi:butyryl-CoA dehydrogenase
MIRDSMRAFAQERLAPFAAEWDRNHTFPAEALKELGELGALGMVVPEEWDGAGMDYMSLVLVLEEIAAGDGATSTIVSVQNSLACGITMKYGSDAQKEEWLKPLARGEKLGCFCLTEPHTGSDASAITTRAERDGDHFVLNGVKQFITTGKYAHMAIVFAVTDKAAGKKGISCFLVPTDTPGYIVGRIEEKMGQHASDTAQILFENCRVPARCLLGQGRRRLQDRPLQPRSRAASASPRRRSAWRAPPSKPRALRQGARDLRQADHRASGGQFPPRRHGDPDRCRPPDGLARRHAQGRRQALPEGSLDGQDVRLRDGREVCSDAIQIHGGYGYVSDFPVERIYRDVRVCQIYEGANDIQRLVIGGLCAGPAICAGRLP